MRFLTFASTGLLLTLALPAGAQTPKFLENIRQLTFGGLNAEAYWAPDGERLIFQATRDGGQCDQIYVMNADGSGMKMVSTGKGVTTCGYFLPDGKHIVYASTHEGRLLGRRECGALFCCQPGGSKNGPKNPERAGDPAGGASTGFWSGSGACG